MIPSKFLEGHSETEGGYGSKFGVAGGSERFSEVLSASGLLDGAQLNLRRL